MRTFRSVVAAVAAIAAVVLCFAAVPALWLDEHVVQEDGFVALTAPLAADEQFQQSLADGAAEALLQETSVPAALAQLAQPMVEAAADSLTEDPQFPQAWTETLRSSHQLTFGDPAVAQTEGALLLDLAPLVSMLTAQASDSLGTQIPTPERVPVSIAASDQQQNFDLLVRYAGLGAAFAAAAAVAFALALLVAQRRSTTVAMIGAGVLVAAGGWKLGTDFVAERLVAGAQGSPLGALFVRHFAEAAQASFLMWIIAAAAGGAVLVMVGGIGRIFAGSQN